MLALLVADPAGLFVYHGSHVTFSIAYVLAEFVLGMLLAVHLLGVRRLYLVLGASVALVGAHYSGYQGAQEWAALLLPALLVYLVSIAPVWRLPDVSQDWSYGTYVYAWPIEQWVNWRFPGLSPMALVLVVVPLILMVAAASWMWVEEPAIRWAKSHSPRPGGNIGVSLIGENGR